MGHDFDLGRTLRTARRRSDMSQRELARAAGIAPSTLAKLEALRTADPRLSTLRRLFRALDLRLAGLDVETGTELITPAAETWRDKAGRHYPPHLEPIPCVGRDDYIYWGWLQYSTWADPPTPDYTYFVDRSTRDWVREYMDPWREWVERGPVQDRSPRSKE